MLRVRGAIVLAAGLPFWIYLVRFINEVRKSPFGYEFGSVAFPLPTQFRVARFVAVISLLCGLSLLVADSSIGSRKGPLNHRDRPDNRTYVSCPAFHFSGNGVHQESVPQFIYIAAVTEFLGDYEDLVGFSPV